MQRGTLTARILLAAYRATRQNDTLLSKVRKGGALSLGPPRLCTTSSSPNGDVLPPDDLDILADPDNKVLRDVYCSAEGEEIFSVDAEADLSTIDWGEFERAFGLNASDEDIDEGWEQLTKDFNFKSQAESRSKDRNGTFDGRVFTKKGLSIEFVTTKKSIPVQNSIQPDSETRPGKKAVVNSLKQSENEPLSHLHHVSQRPASDRPDAFRQPANKSRPGYEYRVMNMEREMEKIAVDVLCRKDSEWYSEGGDVKRILLSPNMKNLTIFFSLEDSQSLKSVNWWRKMNLKCASRVRSALAKRLRTKYVPHVHFEQTKDGDDSQQAAGPGTQQLDLLFDQIAAERGDVPGEAAVSPAIPSHLKT